MLFVYKAHETKPISQPNFFIGTKLNTCHTESVRGLAITASHGSGLWYFEVDGNILHSNNPISGIMRCNSTGIKYEVTFPTHRDLILTMEALNKLKFGVSS